MTSAPTEFDPGGLTPDVRLTHVPLPWMVQVGTLRELGVPAVLPMPFSEGLVLHAPEALALRARELLENLILQALLGAGESALKVEVIELGIGEGLHVLRRLKASEPTSRVRWIETLGELDAALSRWMIEARRRADVLAATGLPNWEACIREGRAEDPLRLLVMASQLPDTLGRERLNQLNVLARGGGRLGLVGWGLTAMPFT